jgi:acetate kinase
MPEASPVRILAINSGSSSLKVALYEMDKAEKLEVAIGVRRIGIPGGSIRASDAHG